MAEQIETAIKDLRQIANDARAAFGSLSPEQLNWKPSEKEWSVAQCFDHLIVTHGLYFNDLERLASGHLHMTFWQRYSPLSGFFGRFLIKGLDPKNQKRMKTTAKAFPSQSEIGGDIIERFASHQSDLADLFKRTVERADPAKQIVTSPLLGFVTYRLTDALAFVPMHCRRHFEQAKRVTAAEGFPK
jgi:hypothetical protein